jgi:hypothetical protein
VVPFVVGDDRDGQFRHGRKCTAERAPVWPPAPTMPFEGLTPPRPYRRMRESFNRRAMRS